MLKFLLGISLKKPKSIDLSVFQTTLFINERAVQKNIYLYKLT